MTPAVTISASFRAGSAFDPPEPARPRLSDGPGASIGGPRRRSAAMLADELDDRGVSLRVSTNRQALTVSCTCLSEDFDDVLAIVVDVARNPTFPDGGDREAPVRSAHGPPAERGQPGARARSMRSSSCFTRRIIPTDVPRRAPPHGVERLSRGRHGGVPRAPDAAGRAVAGHRRRRRARARARPRLGGARRLAHAAARAATVRRRRRRPRPTRSG